MSKRLSIVAAYAALTCATAGVMITCTTTPPKSASTQPSATATSPATTTSQPGRGRGGGRGGFGGGPGFGGRGGRGGGAATRPTFPFHDQTLSLDERLDDLISRMTLDEKAAQMNMDAPEIERLSINEYHWWNEALHGVARAGEATVFPQAIGMAATWNTALHMDAAKVIAVEGRAKHHQAARQNNRGQYFGLDFWSPNINIFRDPRWGRGQETYGEDPYLTSRLGIAFVKGLQGDDRFYFHTIATPKHFAVHSGPEMERHRFDAQPTTIDLFTTYLPAFEATVREGKAYSVMAAYQSLNGISCTANSWLLNDILRKQWGFEGYVTSDVDSVRDVFINHQHVQTPEEAAAMSVKAGCDLNGGTTYNTLANAVRLGYLTERELDVSLRRLFAARFRLGEFDPPGSVPYASTPATANDTRQNDALAHRMARESIVLLKNANNTLPLQKNLRSIAVIGPTADSLTALLGNYNGTPSRPITILQGIRNSVPLSTRVQYVQGSPMVTEEIPLAETIPASCFFTDATKTKQGLYGTYFNSLVTSDRPIRTRIDPNVDISFPEQAVRDSLPYASGFYAKWTGIFVPPDSGEYQLGFLSKDAFRLTIDDKLVVDQFYQGGRRSLGYSIRLEKDKAYNIVAEYVHPPSAGGGGGGAGGGGGGAGAGGGGGGRGGGAQDTAYAQLRWTRPTPDGQAAGIDGHSLFANAVRAAQASDAVVLVLGLTAELEREEAATHHAGFDGGDRSSLDLPLVQENLLKAVKAAAGNKPVVLVLTSGCALSVNWANDNINSILHTWYPGQRGDAVADVLFGAYNPAGRLPVTFYKSVNDLPKFEDYNMGNRTYRYFSKDVLYPFGYGLSYSRFEYANLQLSSENITSADNITASITVRNASNVAGDEVVQCYLDRTIPPAANNAQGNQAMADLAQQPRKTLVGFLRVRLEPNESRTVKFTITPHQLSTVNSKGERSLNPQATGGLSIRVGAHSANGLSRPVQVTGAASTPPYQFIAPRLVPAAPPAP